MDRAPGQVRQFPPSPKHGEPAPAHRMRLRRPETYSCGDCANKLGKSAEWFRKNLEQLYARGMPQPIDQPGHRRWETIGWDAWRLGFNGPKDAANDAAPAEPVTVEGHRERLHRAYGGAR